MKTVGLEPLGREIEVRTCSKLLGVLLSQQLDVLHACGGRGICATCHVHVKRGMEDLSPMQERERLTLGIIQGTSETSRLACQARVLGESVVVEVLEGMYLEESQNLLVFLGQRAKVPVLHPITGEVLVQKGKIITRTRIEELRSVDAEVKSL